LNSIFINYSSTVFTLRASRSHYIGFVAAHSQYTYTTSWATALTLQQSQLVNNPGGLLWELCCTIIFLYD